MKETETKKGRHSRVFLSGISLLYVVRQIRKRLPCFTKTQKAGDPRLRHSGMTASFGFTLIELLVVVLIIGILAAVALPQYQTAVNKSRYAGLMPLAKSVKDAEEAQLMATGRYTSNLEDLSVQVPGTIEPENTATGDHVTIELYNGDGNYDFVKATDTRNPANTYVMYFAKSGNFKGEIHCEAESGNEKAKQLCLSYGPTAGPFTGTDSGYDAYVLQGTGDGTGSGASVLDSYAWNCNPGGCVSHDEHGNTVATRACLQGNEFAGTCTKMGEQLQSYSEYTYDTDGNKLSQESFTCSAWNANGSCSAYSSMSEILFQDNSFPWDNSACRVCQAVSGMSCTSWGDWGPPDCAA